MVKINSGTQEFSCAQYKNVLFWSFVRYNHVDQHAYIKTGPSKFSHFNPWCELNLKLQTFNALKYFFWCTSDKKYFSISFRLSQCYNIHLWMGEIRENKLMIIQNRKNNNRKNAFYAFCISEWKKNVLKGIRQNISTSMRKVPKSEKWSKNHFNWSKSKKYLI